MNFKTYLKESLQHKIGIFCGAFKPPHAGHFKAALKASKENNSVMIIVSPQPRDMITGQMSFDIWMEFANHLDNVSVLLAKGSPVKETYDQVDNINKKFPGMIVNLYAARDDMARFERIGKFSDRITVNKIETTQEANDKKLSASHIRDAITKGDWNFVMSCYPAEVDKTKILHILKP